MKTRILLADDHKIMRQGLKALLGKEATIEVVGETIDGRGAVAFAKKFLPDVVIMDITMPNLNGIEATALITAEIPEVKVIGLSMHFDKHFVAKMLRAGARGYLRKDCASEELIEAIRTVVNHKIYVSPHLGFPTTKNIFNGSEIGGLIATSLLTAKEREVLQLVAEGKPTKGIATTLRVSGKTIDKHRQRIMEKLDIHTIAELTKFAIREGITSADI